MSVETMALADRIRIVMASMEGVERGKQTRLSGIAGAGRGIVNHWLTGEIKTISFDHALAISKAFGYRTEWLIQGRGPMREAGADTDEASTGLEKFAVDVTLEELRLLTRYRGASAMGRALIETVCQSAPQEQHQK